MSEWKEYKLDEVYDFASGLSKPRSEFGFGYGFLAYKDIFANYFVPDELSQLVNSTEKERKTCSVLKGDVFLTRTSETDDELGMSSVALKDYPEATFNGFTKRLRPKGIIKVVPEYAGFYFRSPGFRAAVSGISSITTRASLNNGMLSSLSILLPEIEEQQRIAGTLKALHDKIDLLNRQNVTLEKMAETLFRQWFVEEAKEEWETVKLKEVTDIAIGRTPPRKEAHWFTTNSNDVKWISIKDMGDDGAFISNTSEYLTRDAVTTFNVPVIPKDTVVLSFKMTVGRVAITVEEMISNEAIAHFKFNKQTPFTKEYLYIFLKTYKYDALGSTSSIVTAINSAMIKDMEIIIPDEKTMRAFQEITEPFFNKIFTNQTQIRTLSTLRDTLLPKLMNGEVRVAGV